jgi:myosin-5
MWTFSDSFVAGAYINEDGELALAYETQKTINKQLELELQDEKSKYKAHEREYKLEIEKLREDNERQQRLLSANLTNTPQTQSEAFMQHEITRLTTENLDLHDKNDTLAESVRKLKKQVKLMAKKLKEAGLDLDDTIADVDNEPKTNVNKHTRALPSIRKKERDYLGMFSYPSGEENTLTKQLVIGECGFVILSLFSNVMDFRTETQNCRNLAAWSASLHNLHVHTTHRLR